MTKKKRALIYATAFLTFGPPGVLVVSNLEGVLTKRALKVL